MASMLACVRVRTSSYLSFLSLMIRIPTFFFFLLKESSHYFFRVRGVKIERDAVKADA